MKPIPQWWFNGKVAVVALVMFLQQVAVAADPPVKGANNETELNNEFPLTKAPKFEASKEQMSTADQVIGELKNHYGGTLVVTPAGDPNLDSPAFLSRYLRDAR